MKYLITLQFEVLSKLKHSWRHIFITIPMVKVPSTAMVNTDVVPIAVKQNSIDVACASDGIKTTTVSERKSSLLFMCQVASLSKRQVLSVGSIAP